MSVGDILLLLVRWLHALAAMAWVGGSVFYLFVLRPALRQHAATSGPLARLVGAEFRTLVTTAMAVLLSTGIVLTASRLTSGNVGVAYVAVLAVKIAMALYMFHTVRFSRRGAQSEEAMAGAPSRLRKALDAISGANAVLALGVIVLLLADILRMLVEVRLAS